MPRPKGYRGVTGPIFVDDDDAFLAKQQARERILEYNLANIIDLTSDYVMPTVTRQRPPTEHILDSYQCPDGAILLPGMALQIKHARGKYQAKYFKIIKIVSLAPKTEPILRGWLFTRSRNLEGRLPKTFNEVCLVADIDNTDPSPWEDQALVDLEAQELHRIRELRTTNAPFPEFRYSEDKDYDVLVQQHGASREFFEKHGALVCRFRFLRYFNGQEMIKKNKPYQWAIARVSEREADDRYRIPTAQVVRNWRGRCRLGGSHVPAASMVGNGPITGLLLPGQTYSTGDMFAGAGGVSRGMTLAGAHVAFAVDNWDRAVGSLQRNFKSTDVHHRDVTDFVTSCPSEKVDILHLSPPCQTWSPAHTNPGKNDEINEAALLACGHLVAKCKPRLFTLEQTFGIIFDKNQDFFNALIHSFTDHGYSVRWQMINLATYGLPQPRKRLIIIGAGPAESLPDFPKPTHAKDGLGGLKPFVTVRQALAPLANSHGYGEDEDHRFNPFKDPKSPWDPDQPLSNTITCGGGKDNYHWDGTRDFTVREFALLQGFPPTHRFVGTKTDRKKQIGNAFPPSIVKVLYSHLIKWLDKQDGIRNRPLPAPAPAAFVCLDADPIDVDKLGLELSAREKKAHAIVNIQDDNVMVIDSDDGTSGTETARGSPAPALSLHSSPREKTRSGGIRTCTPSAFLSPFLSRSNATRHSSITRRETKMAYRSLSLQRTREGSGLRDDPFEVSD